MSSSEDIEMQDGPRDDGLRHIKNSEETPPFAFLQLPREIRDQIYEDVLDSAVQQPPPEVCEIINKNPILRQEDRPHGVVYDYNGKKTTPTMPCVGLLRSNHQISDEMSEAIRHRNKSTEKGVQYRLYLIACYKSLLPNWLFLPAPLKFVKSLHVDLQLATEDEFQWVGPIGSLAELPLELFLRFARYGIGLREGLESQSSSPSSQSSSQGDRQRIIQMPYLDKLTLNIVPALDEGYDDDEEAEERRLNLEIVNGTLRAGCRPAIIDHMTFKYLGRYLAVVTDTGLFHGKVGVFRLRYREYDQEYRIKPRTAP